MSQLTYPGPETDPEDAELEQEEMHAAFLEAAFEAEGEKGVKDALLNEASEPMEDEES